MADSNSAGPPAVIQPSTARDWYCCGIQRAWRFIPTDVRAETKLWLRMAVPIAVSMAGVFALQFVELAFLGHLQTQYLAGASVAGIWLNVTSAFLWQGFGNALSALVSQAMGAGNLKRAGIWLQQGVFWSVIFTVPIGILWLETEPILVSFHFNHSDAKLAGVFARWRILGLIPTTLMNILIPYLQAQDVLLPGVLVNVCAVGLDVALHAILLRGVGSWNGLGYIGSPIASSITAWCALFSLGWYVFVKKKIHVKTWPGWNLEFLSWSYSKQFLLEQAMPAGIATSCEELQLEAISFMAARLGRAQVSAHNSLLSLLMLMNAFSFGAINATTIRVAYYLGLGDIRMAKNVSWITICILGAEGILVGMVLVAGKRAIPEIFSNDPNVIRQAESIMLLLALAYVLVSVFFTAVAVLQGQGRPVLIALSFVLGAWLLGVPLAHVFSRVMGLGLRGLWIGIVVGYVVTTVLAGMGMMFGNWTKIRNSVVARSQEAHTTLPQVVVDVSPQSDNDNGMVQVEHMPNSMQGSTDALVVEDSRAIEKPAPSLSRDGYPSALTLQRSVRTLPLPPLAGAGKTKKPWFSNRVLPFSPKFLRRNATNPDSTTNVERFESRQGSVEVVTSDHFDSPMAFSADADSKYSK